MLAGPMTKHEPSDASEITFGFDELFFSRTDPAGIIEFGNSVFQRVSIYGWDELLGKPHKVVRNPDTPRAAFYVLWDTIKQGVPFGAYVKNRAKDGRYYWVYAIVTPVEGGYLSVRLRPSSDLFAVIKQEYLALSGLERRDRLAPADSAALLLQRLEGLGFPNYPTFMATALGKELAARDERLGRPRDRTIEQFDDLLTTAQSLLKQADIIAAAYACNENVPFNFRVLAAQLGQEGAAIGVISTNYTLLSTEMKAILTEFVASAQEVFRTINDGYFLACTARVQREMVEFFRHEELGAGMSREQEMLMLDRQQAEYGARAAAGLLDIARKAAGFQQACLDMNRLAAALEVTRVMGKVECARHTDVKDRMDELLNDLESFQKTIAAALKELDHMNQHIRREADELLAHAKAA
jgi:hypothetical protein